MRSSSFWSVCIAGLWCAGGDELAALSVQFGLPVSALHQLVHGRSGVVNVGLGSLHAGVEFLGIQLVPLNGLLCVGAESGSIVQPCLDIIFLFCSRFSSFCLSSICFILRAQLFRFQFQIRFQLTDFCRSIFWGYFERNAHSIGFYSLFQLLQIVLEFLQRRLFVVQIFVQILFVHLQRVFCRGQFIVRLLRQVSACSTFFRASSSSESGIISSAWCSPSSVTGCPQGAAVSFMQFLRSSSSSSLRLSVRVSSLFLASLQAVSASLAVCFQCG